MAASLSLSRQEFEELSDSQPVVPLATTVVMDVETPVSAFLKVVGDRSGFLLESVEQGERWGRHSFIGLDPFLTLTSGPAGVSSDAAMQGAPKVDGLSPPEAIRRVFEHYRSPHLPGLPPFYSGAVGYIGYEFSHHLERLPLTTERDVEIPDLMLMFPRTVVAFDHLRQRATIVSNSAGHERYDDAVDRINSVLELLARSVGSAGLALPLKDFDVPASTMKSGDFISAVGKVKEYILAGDIFQAVLSHRLSLSLEDDAFDVYRRLRLINPSPYMFFVRHPEVTVLGSSPEPLVKVSGRTVLQRPIAGTRPRGKSDEEDLAIEQEFLRDEKERAEHVMLVDLARNDLGRVCRYGTVEVEELMKIERYSHVMHLVSQVSGQLADGCTALDALYASFPAGTVSGAPKIRAMEIIDELEPTRRGPYAGVVGYFDLGGNLDTAIALRTGYVAGGSLHVQVGAGIVADSVPEYEWTETMNKAAALLTAASPGGPSPGGPSPSPRRSSPSPRRSSKV